MPPPPARWRYVDAERLSRHRHSRRCYDGLRLGAWPYRRSIAYQANGLAVIRPSGVSAYRKAHADVIAILSRRPAAGVFPQAAAMHAAVMIAWYGASSSLGGRNIPAARGDAAVSSGEVADLPRGRVVLTAIPATARPH